MTHVLLVASMKKDGKYRSFCLRRCRVEFEDVGEDLYLGLLISVRAARLCCCRVMNHMKWRSIKLATFTGVHAAMTIIHPASGSNIYMKNI